MSLRCSKSQICPVCNQLIQGSLEWFESHVNSHFFDERLSTLDVDPILPAGQSQDPDFPDHLIGVEFDIDCEAPGCNMKVSIDKMAEHMDRHLAEQIRDKESAQDINPKRSPPYQPNDKDNRKDKNKGKSITSPFSKRTRIPSPEMSSFYDDEEVQNSLTALYGDGGDGDDDDDDKDNFDIPIKKARSRPPENTKSPKKPLETTKQSGQTTMDGFFKKTIGSLTSTSNSSTLVSSTPTPTPTSSSTSSSSSPKAVSSPPGPKKSIFGSFKPSSTSLNDSSGTPGLIPKARILLNASIAQGVTKQAYLADTSVKFIQSDNSDKGWGCGYRNTQMMLSYVVNQPTTQKEVHQESNRAFSMGPVTCPIPTIKELQQQLEFAWKYGYDVVGANQLKHKVLGTKTWIGTTEVWTILSSLGIRCSILDFHVPSGPNGTHPAMLAAIYHYFRSPAWSPLESPPFLSYKSFEQKAEDQRVIQTAKPPIYIQHQGHSRTIIGIEVLENGDLNLLTFDPGRWLHNAIPSLKEEELSITWESSHGSKLKTTMGQLDTQYLLKAFRLSPAVGLGKSQYQLLGVSGLYVDRDSATTGSPQIRKNKLELLKQPTSLSIGWNEVEAEESKLVTSTQVP